MIKAIETHYKGYRFRSRLEARWAVFFDALGIEWLYEHEGYQLPSGLYLPDFWLPKLEMYAEVKPETPTAHEWQLCKELALITFTEVVVLDGLPSTKNYWGWIGCKSHPLGAVINDETDMVEPYAFEFDYAFCAPDSFITENHLIPIGWNEYPERENYGYSSELSNYRKWPALEICRSARFEHGETPMANVR